MIIFSTFKDPSIELGSILLCETFLCEENVCFVFLGIHHCSKVDKMDSEEGKIYMQRKN